MMRRMASSWVGTVIGMFLVFSGVAQAGGPELAGHWACPAQLQLAAVGQNQLNLQLNTRSHLRSDGRYESSGDAVVVFGLWPLTLAANSRGQWWRDRKQLTVAVEALDLAPGSTSAVEVQRLLIQQINALLPDFLYIQVTQIVAESAAQLVLEDEFGTQYTCTRL